jgi:glycosyltransferase involved in cell wall biosynthesis
MSADAPLVSVLMITYNHAPYVRQAIESVLAQRVSFPIEIVIGEDCSTDGTRDAVHAAVADAPVPVTLIERPSNIGMVPNFVDTLSRCRGQYIALLEGDDWWTDPGKLQRQVDMLRSDEGMAFCFHAVRWTNQRDGGEDHDWPRQRPPVIDFDSIANEVFIQTASVVLRRSMLPAIPAWTAQLHALDWYMFLVMAARGRVGFLPQVMSAYRVHASGATAFMRTQGIHEKAADMFAGLAREMPARRRATCRRMRIKHLELLAVEFEAQGRPHLARRAMLRALLARIRDLSVRRATLVCLLRLTFPRLHHLSLRLRKLA